MITLLAKCFKCKKDFKKGEQVIIETLAVVTQNENNNWDYERDSDINQIHADNSACSN